MMNEGKTELSPCTGLCEIASGSDTCNGCGRTMREIFRWPGMSAEERREVMDRLGRTETGCNTRGRETLAEEEP